MRIVCLGCFRCLQGVFDYNLNQITMYILINTNLYLLFSRTNLYR